MNNIQVTLQQAYKEYLDFKIYIADNSKKTVEELKKEVADKALKKELEEEKIAIYFEEFGERNILKLDFEEVRRKFYYTYFALRDLIEVPEEIAEEIKNIEIKTVFAIIDGKKEIIDKELYNLYKTQHLQHTLASK